MVDFKNKFFDDPRAYTVLNVRGTSASIPTNSGQTTPFALQAPAAPLPPLRTGTAPLDVLSSATKQMIWKVSGGDLWVLAIAMVETSSMSSAYSFGDVKPRDPQKPNAPLVHKVGDDANYGLYKMNWMMIRQTNTGASLYSAELANPSAPREDDRTYALLSGQPMKPGQPLTPDQMSAAVGVKINADEQLATRILLEAMTKWSSAAPNLQIPVPMTFWGGHRQGYDGLYRPTPVLWRDICYYYEGVKDIRRRCAADPGIWTNDTRYWSAVPNV